LNSNDPPRISLSYRDAGVDIAHGDALVQAIKPFAKRTLRPEVLAGIGGFGALIEVSKKYRDPILVASTDGVGTKLKLAFQFGKHDTVGIDLVAMSVNDILAQGAEPVFFLDYFVCERLDVRIATEVIKGIANGCEQAGCALVGGETAEHPDAFPKNEYDLAGFAVGMVERHKIIDGSEIRAGDAVLGLASSGAHSNGFSLIRKVLEHMKPDYDAYFHGEVFKDVLLAPTRIYVKSVLRLLENVPVKGIAHITGGGLLENVPRILPEPLCARLDKRTWPMPPLFRLMQDQGNIDEQEMLRVFNCGIGMTIVVAAEDADRAVELLRHAGETAWRIGEITQRARGAPQTVVE
jgi:phosphoribosylformylglycinamidine cyclo-ligase